MVLAVASCGVVRPSAAGIEERTGCAVIVIGTADRSGTAVSEVAAVGCRADEVSSATVARGVAYAVRQSLTASVDVVEVSMPGRRDPGPVSFTNPELDQLSHLTLGDVPPHWGAVIGQILWLLLPLSYVLVAVGAVVSAKRLRSAGLLVFVHRR